MRKLRVTLVRSPIGFAEDQKRTAKALGLGKLHRSVEVPDNPQTRGMVRAIRHLVRVETVEPVAAPAGAEEDTHAAP